MQQLANVKTGASIVEPAIYKPGLKVRTMAETAKILIVSIEARHLVVIHEADPPGLAGLAESKSTKVSTMVASGIGDQAHPTLKPVPVTSNQPG